jgi:hypothetical protein
VNLWDWEAIDWDPEEDEEGNLVHCMAHGVDEIVVYEVLSEDPVEIRFQPQTADFAIVGPDRGRRFWTLLLARSYKRGDWLRPVTGWQSTDEEIEEWKRAGGGS